MAYRILIFEPNASSGESLMKKLSAMNHCDAIWCSEEAQAMELLDGAKVDAAVLCLSPDGTGLEIIDQRRGDAGIPCLIATQAHDIETRMLGLNRGAVDYLISPFNADELLARVWTVMVRREQADERFVRRGNVILDREVGRVGDGSKWTALSPWELKVFSLLFGGDRPVSKQHLKSVLADRWCMTDNAIEVGIHRLRLKARACGMLIQTYGRAGYVLQDISDRVSIA